MFLYPLDNSFSLKFLYLIIILLLLLFFSKDTYLSVREITLIKSIHLYHFLCTQTENHNDFLEK